MNGWTDGRTLTPDELRGRAETRSMRDSLKITLSFAAAPLRVPLRNVGQNKKKEGEKGLARARYLAPMIAREQV